MVENPSDEVIRDVLSQYQRVAVVGLSDKPNRPSFGIASYLHGHGYTVLPVNPVIDYWQGIPATPSAAKAPGPVEIVDVLRRAEDVPPVVDNAIAAGAKVVWLQLGVVNEEAASRARDAGLIVVQDRCIMVEHQRLLGVG